MSFVRQAQPGEKVFSNYLSDAADRGDVAASQKKATTAFFVLAKALTLAHVAQPEGSSSEKLTTEHPLGFKASRAALKRLGQRCSLSAVDLQQLLLRGSAAQWEEVITSSFSAGMSTNLAAQTVQMQVIEEFKIALLIGRNLTFHDDYVAGSLESSMLHTISYVDASSSRPMEQKVDLLFPASRGSVARVMEAFWTHKPGGKPMTRQQKAAARTTPEKRAMPLRFYTLVLINLWNQSQLMTALVDLNAEMLANKAKGVPKWYHPQSLTKGGQFANNSPALRAKHAALACMGWIWALHQGGRQAELMRLRWWDAFVPLAPTLLSSGSSSVNSSSGSSEDVPLFVLGLGGVFQRFQQAVGTGYWFRGWHCKTGYEYGAPQCMDVLPAPLSGLDFSAVYMLCFVVLQYLQPCSPANPIVQPSEAEPKQTFNNALGFVYGGYGGLAHVPEDSASATAHGDSLASLVNQAVSSTTGVLQKAWDLIRGTTEASTNNQLHNKPSIYSARSTMAGELFQAMQQLGGKLPSDLFPWYLLVAGRSAAAKSWETYKANFTSAFGSALLILSDLGSRFTQVVYRKQMLGRSPVNGNLAACAQLDASGQARLSKAVQLGKLYQANCCTPDIWSYIIDLVRAEGSLGGAFQQICEPLQHGYGLTVPLQLCCDLAFCGFSSPQAAEQQRQQALSQLVEANAAFFGTRPVEPASQPLLQSMVDLLCMCVDSMKLTLSSDPASRQAANRSAAGSALLATVGAVQAMLAAGARGNQLGERDALAEAVRSAAAAVADAQRRLQPSAAPASEPGSVSEQHGQGQQGQGQEEQEQPLQDVEAVLSSAEQLLATSGSASQNLLRGAGLVCLVPACRAWMDRSKPLPGTIEMHGVVYSRYSVLQLMGPAEGLWIKAGHQQEVQVRVAADFVESTEALVGQWTKRVLKLSVWPGESVLLESPATRPVGKQFRLDSAAAVNSFRSLFPSFTEAAIQTRLGQLPLQRRLTRAACCDVIQTQLDMSKQSNDALAAVAALQLATHVSEADQLYDEACNAARPLLATQAAAAAELKRELKELYVSVIASMSGEASAAPSSKAAISALRALVAQATSEPSAVSELSTRPAAQAEARQKRPGPQAACRSKKQKTSVEIDSLPCEVCGGVEVSGEMLVCDWCAACAGHMSCLGFASVPGAEVWFCKHCSGSPQNRQLAQEAADLHGRWVVSCFTKHPAMTFWGRIGYQYFGLLSIQYSDEELWEGVKVAQVQGQVQLRGHSSVRLMPLGCEVPQAVLETFQAKGWLSDDG